VRLSQPRRIHVVALFANRAGGAEVYTTGLVRALVSRGHDVTLICHDAEPDLVPGARIRLIPRPEHDHVPLLWRFRPLLLMRRNLRDLRRLRLEAPDVAIASAQYLTWAYARCLPKVPFLYMPHAVVAPRLIEGTQWGSSLQRRLAFSVSARLERQALNRAFRTIRLSEIGCRAMRTFYGDTVDPRFAVLPAPVDLPPPVRRVRDRDLRLLFVGRLTETKNVDFLLETCASLPIPPSIADDRVAGRGWTLDIVGEGESGERARLEALAAARGLSDRVRFHGHQDDVGRFYDAADLFVFPSRMESFGLVLLEAMSHGLPTLTIRHDGVRYENANHEFIQDGVTGFLADGEAAFRDRLAQLTADPGPLDAVGARARDSVEHDHTWAAHVDHLEGVIGDACAATRPVSAPASTASSPTASGNEPTRARHDA
jgi:glycosyltransferase involved in cell wall biosynthesis